MSNSIGYLYVAVRENYVNEAIASAKSLKERNSNFPIALVTDKKIENHCAIGCDAGAAQDDGQRACQGNWCHRGEPKLVAIWQSKRCEVRNLGQNL